MVCQEPHSTLKSHKNGTHWKHLNFQICKSTATALQKSFYIHIKQMKITEYLGNVLFILSSCACTETDGITEIIQGKSRHYRI